jgi:hypothetical protein
MIKDLGKTVITISLFCIAIDATVLKEGAAVRSILGGRRGKMAYTKFEPIPAGEEEWKTGRSLWYVDFAEDQLVERKICEFDNVEPRNVTFSADGEYVMFNTQKRLNWNDSIRISELIIYAAKCEENATPNEIARGAQANFWTHPTTGKQYIIYNDGDLEENWTWYDWDAGAGMFPMEKWTDTTFILEINSSYEPVGSRNILLPYYANSGRTKSGKWILQAGRLTGTYELNPTAVENAYTGTYHFFLANYPERDWRDAMNYDGCNPSVSPEKELFMHNGANHHHFYIRDPEGEIVWKMPQLNQDGNEFWDVPEWSNLENYGAALGSVEKEPPRPATLYIINIPLQKAYSVVEGEYFWPELWVKDTVATEPVMPTLNLSAITLAVSINQGETVEENVAVINNFTGGEIGQVSAQTSSSWLSVSISGTGDNQKIVNTIDAGELSPGDYTATVEVSAPNSDPESASYTVTLTVGRGVATVGEMLALQQSGSASIPVESGTTIQSDMLGIESTLNPEMDISVTGTSGAILTWKAISVGDTVSVAGVAPFVSYHAFGASTPGDQQIQVHLTSSTPVILFLDSSPIFTSATAVTNQAISTTLTGGKHVFTIKQLSAFTSTTTFSLYITDTQGNMPIGLTFPVPKRPALTLLNPNGGETFHPGDTVYVQWENDPNTQMTIKTEIVFGAWPKPYLVYSAPLEKTDPLWANVPWVVSDSIGGRSAISDSCRIKVSSYDGTYVDYSDKFFSITLPADNSGGCGCGSGTGLALLPPILIHAGSRIRKRKKKTKR